MNENENYSEIENELKHWGILGMKWGIRNYQNPDGSLTPLGRIRYGVGSKSRTQLGAASRDIMGVNDANSLSDEELRRMTKRYRDQAQYYEARNNYIQQERYFKQNTSPQQREKRQSSVGRFMSHVFGQPLENFLSKNVEIGLGFLGYSMLKDEHPDAASQYFNFVTGFNSNNKDNKNNNKYKYKTMDEELNDRKTYYAERDKAQRELKDMANKVKSGIFTKDDYDRAVKYYQNVFNERFDPLSS